MATGASIPDEVRRFVLTSIPSVPYLEALLLLRSGHTQAWDANMLARRLYLSERNAAELLIQLNEAQLLAPASEGPGYRYRPVSAELDAMVSLLAKFYSSHLVEITHLIHSKTDKKAQYFADAFLWRKDS